MLRSGDKVDTVEKLPSPNHGCIGVGRDSRGQSAHFCLFRLMLRVGGFGSVLLYAEGEPLSTEKGMEEATWKSERSGRAHY